MDQKIRKNLLLATIFLAITTFIAGILIGKSLSISKSDDISMFIKENDLRTESYLLEQDLVESFDENNCELAKIRINELSLELYKIGQLFDQNTTEESIGKENYNLLKRKYHLMQIRSYTLFHKIITNCNVDQDIVLYYFGKNDTNSAELGKTLDRIVAERGIIVYAIEYNYSSDLRFLQSYYGLQEQPALIINYDVIKQGPTSYLEIIQILDAQRSRKK